MGPKGAAGSLQLGLVFRGVLTYGSPSEKMMDNWFRVELQDLGFRGLTPNMTPM